ncbi:beta-phosphoglucomutase family hydrolase [Cellulomonas sp. KRMCY2]|uniref:beta-phosphoglucomutase family hydrolase n=1 Tax=Cellulomonas sp. KRMCY2 TaxID=1304865 RepID=UPI00045E94D3|nr:beta-phosphoglucomutase family hydrolase [Cellulomonas sp. KRMCY2]
MVWDRFDGVLFDLDGVLTPTAEVHMRAWHQVFSTYLAARGVLPAYSGADYFAHIDGKPRYDGVRAVLASRGIVLPEGEPADAPGTGTVCGLGNTKQEVLDRLLAQEGVTAYPGSVALLDELAQRAVAVAVVSSSRNTRAVLRAARLADRFVVVVDGELAHDEGLLGKPSAETFLRAAELLGVPVDRAVVIEDAVAGVAAGRAGGFGLVVGVDRGAGAQVLLQAGADVVVEDLAELVTR